MYFTFVNIFCGNCRKCELCKQIWQQSEATCVILSSITYIFSLWIKEFVAQSILAPEPALYRAESQGSRPNLPNTFYQYFIILLHNFAHLFYQLSSQKPVETDTISKMQTTSNSRCLGKAAQNARDSCK